ncbi:MAG: hypothetical protein Udaeo2_28490 [Candidatus Udaeobacter sp.]|nr:MAG: hypothetical protein Udaeo2_28490 [Candidatus Udaeobacter sp.]
MKPRTRIAAGDADDDPVLHDERRAGEAVALVGVRRGDIQRTRPVFASRLTTCASSVPMNTRSPSARAAVLRTAAKRHLFRQRPLVVPERPAGAGVHRIRMVLRRRQV